MNFCSEIFPKKFWVGFHPEKRPFDPLLVFLKGQNRKYRAESGYFSGGRQRGLGLWLIGMRHFSKDCFVYFCPTLPCLFCLGFQKGIFFASMYTFLSSGCCCCCACLFVCWQTFNHFRGAKSHARCPLNLTVQHSRSGSSKPEGPCPSVPHPGCLRRFPLPMCRPSAHLPTPFVVLHSASRRK